MIAIRTKAEIEKLRAANQIVKSVLDAVEEAVKPGITTLELDSIAEALVKKAKARASFKGYRGFPGSLCTSINEEVVHGIPSSKRVLKDGDLLKIDFGVEFQGYYGDSARSVAVGSIDLEAQRLADITREALFKGIGQARAGNFISDIGAAVQECAEAQGFSVVRDFVGHGIGTHVHEEPPVPNFVPEPDPVTGLRRKGARLEAGMVLAIEPMVNAGTHQVRVLADDWTVVTQDGKLSSHFEHSIVVREGEPDILSQ